MTADLLELKPDHAKKLMELFYQCMEEGMPKEKAYKEMYKRFFDDEKNWLKELPND